MVRRNVVRHVHVTSELFLEMTFCTYASGKSTRRYKRYCITVPISNEIRSVIAVMHGMEILA
jgi:hypothetical protein